MSVVVNEVRRATYLDSIVLMRISRQIAGLPGVAEAGLFIGTPANKEILRDAGILGPEAEAAGPGDLILAVRASDDAVARAALAAAERMIDQPASTGAPVALGVYRSLRAAARQLPGANLALISVPGDFAVAEARKALELGLHVMIFSDNVPIEEEAALKREARERGLMVMGPDCGTAIISGAAIAFANVVPRGDIGIIGASGTGIQEVSCLIARAGRGVSHGIGTGGRDLKPEVGAITTLMAIDALDADAATKHIVLISKPPTAFIAKQVLDRVARSSKPFTICFLGASGLALPANARAATTLKAAAALALGQPAAAIRIEAPALRPDRGRQVRGLYAGGTLCAEAQLVFLEAGLPVTSNAPVPGATLLASAGDSRVYSRLDSHVMVDLGDDTFTRGRPHPMIDPAVRDDPLCEALADPAVGIVLIDIVLGFGAHPDPAGHVAGIVAAHPDPPLVIAAVTGTDADPQPRTEQVDKLMAAGAVVAESNADAAATAIASLARPARLRVVRP
jgi:FdrA protein